MKIGIPRGLSFYNYYPFWAEFFRFFNVQVIVTPNTTKQIMDDGVKLCVDDACLPIKVYHGHVNYLKNKCDKIFVPRLVSVNKHEFICPKFCGLPEMLKNSIQGLPDLIDTTIDMNRNNKQIYSAVYQLGRYFTNSISDIAMAYIKSLNKLREYRRLLYQGYLATHLIDDDKNNNNVQQSPINDKYIGLIGHPYNIYDAYISMDIINKLLKMGYRVLTPEMVRPKTINKQEKRLPKKMFWTFAKRIYGSAMSFAKNPKVKGIIYLSSFGCGQDAFIWEIIFRTLNKISNIPLVFITIDEHTGEAGFVTRLEAFIDMIEWREKHESNVSAYR